MNGSLMDVTLLISLVLLLVSAVLAMVRLVRGPSLADRVVALDLIGMILVGTMVINAVLWRQAPFLDAALAFLMVAFLATVGIGRYLEKRGQSR
ncbi:Multiple resistance and pH regulation protein F (MrpF / PhaF) [Sulfidibacter corallicola]|uniref:Multisubunit sodium/proton antiporter, MrpF subunit n=1 Tax=Sulfidibacter corallicola TaxID=2818388 RepID=A0A8A4TL68_SULCO|nr:monovalent cation/H+ antiporter complex subunit F [Sulfidibacter corallicola]QTD49944.1 hypothetical protein J3U87_30550 [Sulfidibacter corallicola]